MTLNEFVIGIIMQLVDNNFQIIFLHLNQDYDIS
jgi:hypothetical protein